ncbi:MAG: hypothetical protein WCK31_03435 [bacterium]
MNDISDRQKQLLLAIMQEFMESAEAVGSMEISDRYDFDLSPATIRNEMADLMKMGYLYKTHSSAGRIPTTQAWRFYISEAMDEDQVNVKDESEAREKLFQSRFSAEALLKEAVNEISKYTGYASVAILNDSTFFSGISKLLNFTEYRNIDVLQSILIILENPNILRKVFDKAKGNNNVFLLIGDELGIESLETSALVFKHVKLHRDHDAVISVLGPARMNYSKSVPAVKFIAKNLEESTFSW